MNRLSHATVVYGPTAAPPALSRRSISAWKQFFSECQCLAATSPCHPSPLLPQHQPAQFIGRSCSATANGCDHSKNNGKSTAYNEWWGDIFLVQCCPAASSSSSTTPAPRNAAFVFPSRGNQNLHTFEKISVIIDIFTSYFRLKYFFHFLKVFSFLRECWRPRQPPILIWTTHSKITVFTQFIKAFNFGCSCYFGIFCSTHQCRNSPNRTAAA